MNYEDAFTDYDKMRYESAWKGFKYKDYGPMYEYLMRRQGETNADFFLNRFTKAQKKCFCARVVYLFHPDKEKVLKAEKYYKIHKGEIL